MSSILDKRCCLEAVPCNLLYKSLILSWAIETPHFKNSFVIKGGRKRTTYPGLPRKRRESGHPCKRLRGTVASGHAQCSHCMWPEEDGNRGKLEGVDDSNAQFPGPLYI